MENLKDDNQLTRLLVAISYQDHFAGTASNRLFKHYLDSGFDRSLVQPLLRKLTPAAWEWADRELELCREHGIDVYPICAPQYPDALRCIADPPLALFCSGIMPPTRCIAIVGTRRSTDYGYRTAADLAREITQAGGTVVSGLARGIDSAAHEGALSAVLSTDRAASTALHPGIAVLGSGIRSCSVNRRLAERFTAAGGTLVSEYGASLGARKSFFPRRNRIISGMSTAVVIVEAAQRSGSLITAGFALEQGREVWAVPGPIESTVSSGTNTLIAQGARVVCSIEQTVADLGLESARRSSPETSRPAKPLKNAGELLAELALDPPQERLALSVLRTVQRQGRSAIDALEKITEEPPENLAAVLALLEIAEILEMDTERHYRFAGIIDTSCIFQHVD